MKTETTSWTKKQKKTSTTKKASQKIWVSAVVTEKKHSNHPEANVSVFTKTTNPKVVIKSESLKNSNSISLWQKQNKYNMLMFFCFIIICIIILATFFLSLKTYNTVNELAEYIIL